MIQVHVSHLIGEEAIHHEFNIEFNTVTNIKGDEVISIEDNGSGVFIQLGDEELALDYNEEEALLALLLSRCEGRMKLIKKIAEI
jgi:hypothetical protein